MIDSQVGSGDLSVLTRQVQSASVQNASDIATANTNVSSLTTRVTNLEALVPHQPMLDYVTGGIGIYGPFTADFSGGIAAGATASYTVNVSGSIGTKTPIIVFGAPRNAGGSGMAHVSWLAEPSSGSVTVTAFNAATSGTQFGYIVFGVIA